MYLLKYSVMCEFKLPVSFTVYYFLVPEVRSYPITHEEYTDSNENVRHFKVGAETGDKAIVPLTERKIQDCDVLPLQGNFINL